MAPDFLVLCTGQLGSRGQASHFVFVHNRFDAFFPSLPKFCIKRFVTHRNSQALHLLRCSVGHFFRQSQVGRGQCSGNSRVFCISFHRVILVKPVISIFLSFVGFCFALFSHLFANPIHVLRVTPFSTNVLRCLN